MQGHPVLGKIADFFMHTSYFRSDGSPWSTDFGDSSLGSNGGSVVPLLWSLGYRNPGMLWYMQQCRRDGDAGTPGLMLGSPGGLLYAPTAEEMAAIPDLPDVQRSQIFPDMGWVTMRSSWEKDATMLGIKCGYTWNHAHADTGSFILFHRGKYILVDSGKSGYSTPEYDDYYRQSVAHSVVMFNGRAENPEDTYFGSKFIGTTSHLLDAGDLCYVLADATGPTCDTFIRNFRHLMRPLHGPKMNASDTYHFLEFFDLLTSHFDAFIGLFFLIDPLESLNDIIRNIHARHLGLHVPGHTDAFHGGDTGQDKNFFG